MAVGGRADDEAPETVDLPHEAATIALAQWLTRFARAGDFIGLSGDLGAGKTAFARGYLRSVTGQPELEAPSPTFTLLQVYDGPDFPVVHGDFYRLRSAEELAQLGWGETIEGAVALVEWPERAAGALPPDRLEITLSYDAARGDEFRRAELRARGAMTARFKRARAIEAFLERAGWAEANRAPLHGDASSRAYERLTARDGATAILMVSPPRTSGPTLRFGKSYAEIARLSVDIRAFLAMAGGLRAQGYSTPRILARDIHRGLALIEDFGDETVADENGPNASRYAEATSLLADLHARSLPSELPVGHETYTLPVYDIEAMSIEVELALDWYAPVIARGSPSSGARMQFLALWREILAPVLGPRTTWTLRDFHSPNLHWLAERDGLKRLGLIDFQDAVLGPPAYDLASLLQDARCEVPGDLELRLLAHYTRRRAISDPSFDPGAFTTAYSVMGAQRATKILGLFTRLDRRDGKPQYLRLLPRIERTLAKNLAHPVLEPLRQWFVTHLPRALGSAPAEEP
ncbi:MAG: tRNA (adenosine(37)-N6)-threonylcarbamoyltransferase complex ATPase subunit type 1 TsaE [Roseiarcus sp.]